MRKLFILPMTIIIWLVGNSCQKTTADNEPPINPVLRESEVEIPIITSAQTRTFYTSVPDENTIENLDILLFDSQGKFLCWRTTFKINGKLRTTLPVGTGYDAYFLANCQMKQLSMRTKGKLNGKPFGKNSSMQILDDYYKTIRHSQVYQCGGYWRNKR